MERNDTALNGVKMMIADGIVTQEAAEKYFPELKKSKDEREQLIEFLWDLIYKGSSFRYKREDFERWKDWLEKHGETFTKKDDGFYVKGEQILANYTKACKDKQKPADKVEPKFHEGDYVVEKEGHIFEITRIDKDYNGITYACRLIENPIFWSLYYEDEIRLWDITKDAKDGDVLVTGEVIFIFEKIHDGWIYCHSSRHNNGLFLAESYGLITYKYSCEVRPATKEQRDVLFSKMKEAGYEWDAKKLELKKIEQKPADTWKPSEEQIKELEFFISELPKCSVTAQKIVKKGKDTLVSLLSDLKKLREE